MFNKTKHIFAAVVIAFLLSTLCARAQMSSYEELQAAYIFNFAKYVKWPVENESFIIGVYGEEVISEVWENTLSGKKVAGKEIELKAITSMDRADECNIIYLPESQSRNIAELIEKCSGKSILIVTEADLIKKGATISFIIEDDKLRFKLKKASLLQAGLHATEGLLNLAIIL
jgi:hypothetical protein